MLKVYVRASKIFFQNDPFIDTGLPLDSYAHNAPYPHMVKKDLILYKMMPSSTGTGLPHDGRALNAAYWHNR